MKKRCFFITGATGLVGGYLLNRLSLQTDAEIHLLVRASKPEQANQRIDALGHYFNRNHLHTRVTVHCGSISHPNLGLPEESLSLLQSKITDVIHAAASISFTDANTNRQVNLNGTENLLSRLSDSARLFYISTAYVAGMAPSIQEDQLDIGQSFRNNYEQSKFETEAFVRSFYHDRPTLLTVLRPSIITGEVETGRTFQFMTLYRVLRALIAFSRRYRGETFSLEYNPHGTQNYIPIDRLTDMATEIITQPQFWSTTYHLVNDTPVTNQDFRMLLEDRLGFSIANKKPDAQSSNMNRSAVAGNAAYLTYLMGEPAFDCSGRNRLTSAKKPMPFDAIYLDRLIRYCEQISWGKKLAICR